MRRDPAEKAAERTRQVESLLMDAAGFERAAQETPYNDSRSHHLAAANNARLRALCIHLRLPPYDAPDLPVEAESDNQCRLCGVMKGSPHEPCSSCGKLDREPPDER